MSKILPSISSIKSGPAFEASTIRFSRDVQLALDKLTSDVRLGSGGTPTFSTLTLSSLTASRLLEAGTGGLIQSVSDLTTYISGTANEIEVTDDGDGTITIGIVDPLIVAKGGTGVATLTDHGLLVGSGTGAITPLAAATDGQIPIGYTGADPTLATITGSTGITVTNGSGTITLSTTDGEIIHNSLSGLQGGTTDEYYHLTSARHTTLGAIGDLAVTDSNFIVGNGSTWVAESGNTARTSLGLGTGDTPQFARLGLGVAADGTAVLYAKSTDYPVIKEERDATSSTTGFWSIHDFTLTTTGTPGTNNMTVGVLFNINSASGDLNLGRIGCQQGDSVGQYGQLVFKTANNGAPSQWMVLKENGYLGLGGSFLTPQARLDVYGGARFGDSTTNYANFATDGELTLIGTARVTKEFQVEAVDLAPGASGATLTSLGDYPGYAFTINDDMLASFEVPHDWDSTTDLNVVIYWAIDEAYGAGAEVQWAIDWSACPANGTETIDSPTHTGSIDYGDQNIPATAKYLTKTGNGAIAAASLSVGDLIGLTISRVALDGGTNPTAEPIIFHLEVHYTSNKLGEAT